MSDRSNVTPLHGPKDPTGADRQRRFRANRKAAIGAAVTMTTPEICAFAGQLARGPVTAAHIQLAEALLLALSRLLPPGGAIPVTLPEGR